METYSYSYPFMFERLLFILSMFLVLLIGSLSSLQPLCHEVESSALLQFKDSFIINKSASGDPFAYPKVASWINSTDCCSWDGVECSKDTSHVIGLDLSSSFVYGSINSDSSIFCLRKLQRSLADNHFYNAQILSAVGNLSMLTYLNLSYSVFSGQSPESLANLSSLKTLILKNCQLHGEFPTKNFQLPNIRVLRIGGN
jgi:hypothetical protein